MLIGNDLWEVSSRENRLRQRALVALVVFLMLGIGAWLTVDLYYSYKQHTEASRKELENLSVIIESNIQATFGKIDVILSETAHDFAPAVSGRQPRNPAESNKELQRRMSYMPEAQENSLRVVSAQGKVLFNAGETAAVPDVVVADRAYFLRQKNDANAGLVLSEAMLSRFTGKWLLTLSRRIVDPDGRFIGLVQVALRTEYFQGLFELVTIGPQDSITLLDENRRLLARHPPQPDTLGKQFDSLAVLSGLPSKPQTTSYRTGFGIDNLERFYVFRNMGSYPYLLSVGRSTEEIWLQQRSKVYLYCSCYLGLLLAFAYFLWAYVRHQEETEKLATTDSLTGLRNRRSFDSTLDFAIGLRLRNSSRTPLSVILFDIDHFKNINDTLGHLKGDEVLQRVVKVIRNRIRKSDLPCRWGGEEFIVLLNDCNLEQAAAMAENIRQTLETTPMSEPDDGLRISISAGIAEAADDDTVDSLTLRADNALYQAKETGRNRVCVAPPLP